jgi:NDP-sugar pyrophosphorylase family protein
MQVIVPMSGFGERFRRAGYTLPKSLIEVDSKPIIHHIVDLYPGSNFVFICNKQHLEETPMYSILKGIVPSCTIVPIESHKFGPVYAVKQAYSYIDDEKPAIINYCDFSNVFDFDEFKDYIVNVDCDACLLAYKGFHPHSLGTTNYAYIKLGPDNSFEQIKEKEPFTDNRMNEYASTGAYYFRNGRIAKEACDLLIASEETINGEYYCSLAYNRLHEKGYSISVYPIHYFMQWGTPEDLHEYNYWTRIFSTIKENTINPSIPQGDTEVLDVLITMAGSGSRFVSEGYETPKPLLPIFGLPMFVQARNSLPPTRRTYITITESLSLSPIFRKALNEYPFSLNILPSTPSGQALTLLASLDCIHSDNPLLVSSCDHALQYQYSSFRSLLSSDADLCVFSVQDYYSSLRVPTAYGWIDSDPLTNSIRDVLVKSEPEHFTNPSVITGTFLFKDKSYLRDALQSLTTSGNKVNGEYYLDSIIQTYLDAGKKVIAFPVDSFVCWGTPNEFKTFGYWSEAFSQYTHHPYK